MTTKTIHFLPGSITCPIGKEESVLAVALKNELALTHSCGGMGSCTTCRVIVVSCPTPLPPRSELELDIAEMRGFADDERLACQLPPLDGLVVRIPEPST